MLLIHVAALAVFLPYTFSWTAVIVAVASWQLFGMFGITIGYHRLLTHRGFTCPKWLEYSLATIGSCCLQGPPGRWVGTHRAHHQFSDDDLDPHSPVKSFFWGHMGWLFYDVEGYLADQVCSRYAPDLMRKRFYTWLEKDRNYVRVYLVHAAIYWLAGFGFSWWLGQDMMERVQLGTGLVVWGVLFRTVWVWHITWSVNSVSHVFGYRNYKEEPDDSRNNWIVGLMAHGEGWHNNHHADPRSSAHGHRWWELDESYWVIRAMAVLGLAGNVIKPRVMHLKHNKGAGGKPGKEEQVIPEETGIPADAETSTDSIPPDDS
ncbi:MAG: fatty acid desaturase [Pirellulaceae bacterium]|jgi:stearoyl-CoA desaturase (delta-9 desaturase)|nr:fatty acid desaturase [Pirellulaceae bacterium]